MASWDYANLGASCKKNKKEIKQFLKCCGVEFGQVHGSESYCDSYDFKPNIIGTLAEDNFDTIDIYYMANKLFDDVFIYYEYEFGNNTSDYYHRDEEIYNPLNKKLSIVNVDYSFGDFEVFGTNVYDVLNDEINKRANDEHIAIEWNDNGFCRYPANDKLEHLCNLIIEEHGDLQGLGTKTEILDIPEKNVEKFLIQEIADKAGELGYIDLVKIIKEKYNVAPKYISESNDFSSNYSEEEIEDAFFQVDCFLESCIECPELNEIWVPYDAKYNGEYIDRSEKLNINEKVELEYIEYMDNIELYENSIAVKAKGEIIGFISIPGMAILLDAKKIKVEAHIQNVIPLSKRSKRCKKPIVVLSFNYKKI